MNKFNFYGVIIICITIIGFIIFDLSNTSSQPIDASPNVVLEDKVTTTTSDEQATVPTENIPDDKVAPFKPISSSSQIDEDVVISDTKPVTSNIKSKIDTYGVDLYTLKEGVTSIQKIIPDEAEITYEKSGDSVKTSLVTTSGVRLSSSISSIAYINPIDQYGTDLTDLKEGKTVISTTINTTIDITYTRNGNEVQTTVAKKSMFGNSTSTSKTSL